MVEIYQKLQELWEQMILLNNLKLKVQVNTEIKVR